MPSKTCFKCNKEKPLKEFYKHDKMLDGYLNKCKECTKIDVKKNYRKNIKQYKLYEWKRNDTEKRKLHNKKNKLKIKNNNVGKKANYLLTNAIRDKRIFRGICLICNTNKNIEGHHFDYDKPLDVWWLCKYHHNRVHKFINLLKILGYKK